MGGAGRQLAYLTLPKVQDVAAVAQADALLREHEARLGREPPVPLQVLIESPAALARLDAIAAHPRVEALCFGLMDYVSSFGGAVGSDALHGSRQFEHPLLARALADIALSAHAHGKVAVHSVTLAIGDGEAAGRDAQRAAHDFGYQRKWSIHPVQVAPIIAAFRPALNEVQQAAGILLAAREAGWGPVRHDGHLHDRASYRYWWQVLQRAHRTGVSLPPEAAAAFFGDVRRDAKPDAPGQAYRRPGMCNDDNRGSEYRFSSPSERGQMFDSDKCLEQVVANINRMFRALDGFPVVGYLPVGISVAMFVSCLLMSSKGARAPRQVCRSSPG